MLNKLKEMRESGSEEGFTLIELMIVVVIIGILAAIAIPIFSNQQKSAIVAGVKSDIKNTTTNIVTGLVRVPTASVIYANSTASGITLDGVTVAKVVSDPATQITVGGSWAGYWVLGTNGSVNSSRVTIPTGTWNTAPTTNVTPSTVATNTSGRFGVFYNSTTGKTTVYGG